MNGLAWEFFLVYFIKFPAEKIEWYLEKFQIIYILSFINVSVLSQRSSKEIVNSA